MIKELREFSEITCFDFEYQARPGEHVEPHCVVAHELRGGGRMRRWRDRMGSTPPYRVSPDCLFVSFNAAAELSCHLALGWELPIFNLNLCQEFKCLTNGLTLPSGNGLLGALEFYGLDSI